MLPRDLRHTYFHGDWAGHALLTYFLENMEWDKEKVSTFGVGRYKTEVRFGEYATTKGQICCDLGIKRGCLTDRLAKLKRMGMITERGRSKYSIFKVNPELAETIWEQRRHNSGTTPAAYKETKKKNESLDSNKLESCENRPESPLQFDSEGTPAIFENPPTEKKSNTPRKRKKAPPVVLADRVGGFLLSDIKNAWNEHCGVLPKIRGFNKKNTENLERCLVELSLEGEDGLKYFSTAVEKLGKADWVGNYKINFNWFVRSSSHIEDAFNAKNKKEKKAEKDINLEDYF